jgi:hypothetical protein
MSLPIFKIFLCNCEAYTECSLRGMPHIVRLINNHVHIPLQMSYYLFANVNNIGFFFGIWDY